MPKGRIVATADHGTIWQLFYEIDGNGLGIIHFDHGPFAHFYEGATGRSFFTDYRFGAGREQISRRLKDLRIEYNGDTVRLED